MSQPGPRPLLESVERLRMAQPSVPPPPSPSAEDAAEEVRRLRAEREAAWDAVCPARFRGAAPEGFDHPDETLEALARWARGAAEGAVENLLLFGLVGRGKSWAALACCREAHMAGRSVRFEPVVELLDRLRPEGGGNPGPYLAVDLLVLDDLGGERPSDWTAERLYLIVNRRWLDRRPIIATSNVEPKALRTTIGDRTFDRLRDGATVLRLGGDRSRRGH